MYFHDKTPMSLICLNINLSNAHNCFVVRASLYFLIFLLHFTNNVGNGWGFMLSCYILSRPGSANQNKKCEKKQVVIKGCSLLNFLNRAN